MSAQTVTGRRFVLDHEGSRYEVETEAAGLLGNTARLYVDGEQVAESRKDLEKIKLETDGLKVSVDFNLRHQVKKLHAVDPADESEKLYFLPPEGTLMARLHRWERERPVLYASRHVAIAGGQLLFGLLGLGVFFRLLLPRVPWPDIDLPDLPRVDLPDLPRPHIPWPDIDLPDVHAPGWLAAALAAAKFWAPVLGALLVAAHEVDKNRKKHAKLKAAAESRPADTPPSPEPEARPDRNEPTPAPPHRPETNSEQQPNGPRG